MLEFNYNPAMNELLVDGSRNDYFELAARTRQVFAPPHQQEVRIQVGSCGEQPVTGLVIRKGESPNRVFYESGDVVFTVAPGLLEAFLSFIDFPPDDELKNQSVKYHSHYDWIWDDGFTVSKDSIDTVFCDHTFWRTISGRAYNEDPPIQGRFPFRC